jgi:hypothetical protein
MLLEARRLNIASWRALHASCGALPEYGNFKVLAWQPSLIRMSAEVLTPQSLTRQMQPHGHFIAWPAV